MSTPQPEERIHILEGSLRCFLLGAVSLVPLLGAPFAVAALRQHYRVRHTSTRDWNPARRYLQWGLGLAIAGSFLALAAMGVVLLYIQEALHEG